MGAASSCSAASGTFRTRRAACRRGSPGPAARVGTRRRPPCHSGVLVVSARAQSPVPPCPGPAGARQAGRPGRGRSRRATGALPELSACVARLRFRPGACSGPFWTPFPSNRAAGEAPRPRGGTENRGFRLEAFLREAPGRVTAPATRAEGGTAGAQTGGLGESRRCRRSSCGGVPWIEAPAPRVIAAKLRRVHVAGAAPGPPRASALSRQWPGCKCSAEGPGGTCTEGSPGFTWDTAILGFTRDTGSPVYVNHRRWRGAPPRPPPRPARQALLALNGAPGCPRAAPHTALWEGRVVSLASSTAQSP